MTNAVITEPAKLLKGGNKMTLLTELKPFDLHLHTYASDGIYSPAEMVRKASEAGIKTIAITDHDTLAGIEEAQRTGEKFGVRVIPGVELSTKYDGKSVDILGYNVSANDTLNDVLIGLRDGREDRALRIIKKFTEIKMPITMDDIREFSQGGVIARPHIAKAIVKKGYISDYQSVFDNYLADGKPCAIEKVIISPQEGIDLIHQSGGIAVLAHPILTGDDDFIRELLSNFNFDGIEVWHRKQTKEDNERYKKMAKEFDLIMTGGSDFHNDEHQLGVFGFEKMEECVG
ncbi:PHP domain-containing protein [Paenibacillus thermotolerans]|uniref:PHP domain-containing protein n=1 Tax=Paenibacillus thermotolerans TaxID=3027807 RepID=UPI002367A233|nr:MULTISPECIES: PHP domain-containing protein [unclassified Paenibacillus]